MVTCCFVTYYLYFCEQQTKRRNFMKSIDLNQFAKVAKALGHPTRLQILYFLASQESCFFGDIHEIVPAAKATVSQHLKELKDAALIQGEIEAPKVRYCINKGNWEQAKENFSHFFSIVNIEKASCCNK